MIQVTVALEEKKGGVRGRLKRLRDALKGPTMVKVGFPAGAAAGDLISIAYWQHEGTNRAKGDVFYRGGQVGISGPIPPRPFVAVAMFRGRGSVRSFLRAEAKSILTGTGSIARTLPRLGLKGQDLIQVQIGWNMGPALSGMTIKLKGSSRSLVDTGRMLAGVTWKVDG